ncbi:molybdopterin molybdotransferase MoeA [Leucobacter iarius]|uniref:Molybdopterin molybdenumtransferase n=2 Tax=Leucobacter iarius TaxID=333963 RepID=A0ABN2LGD5_9MICO
MSGGGAVTAEEHLRWILDRIPLLPVREAALAESAGLVLAADVDSPLDLPLWDNSAMDGYAVRAVDLAGAGADRPVTLRVIGEVAAGSPEDPRIGPGEAVRIMTGAPLPSSADAVVPVEWTAGEDPADPWAEHEVRVLRAVEYGANVRRRGEDVSAGTPIASAGDRLSAARIAGLAAAGVTRVRVRPRPRVAILVTGSELRAPGEPLDRGQIPESNSVLLRALLAENGIEASRVLVSGDDAGALAERLDRLGASTDVVITTGGVGPGRHDVVRIALEREPEVRAVRVAVRPGQPQCVGRLTSGAWIFALPGNPVSAAVSFELFVRPALLHAQGRGEVERIRVPARAAVAWRGAAGRLQVLPIRIEPVDGGLACRPAVDPGGVSHAVGGHGSADGYALVPAERGDVAAGETVDVILVDR